MLPENELPIKIRVHAPIGEDSLSEPLTKFYEKGGSLDLGDVIYLCDSKWVVSKDPIYKISSNGDIQCIHIYLALQ